MLISLSVCLIVLTAQCAADHKVDQGPSDRPVVGAIRWDAWHGDESDVGLIVEQTLAPSHYHHRLPFFAEIVGENAVKVRGHTQEVMDQEIRYASNAGLDYWAFVTYPEDHALSLGLKLYLSSEKRDMINFCLNLQGGWTHAGGLSGWPEKVQRYVEYFKEPTYQTVLDGRPLVYLYSVEDLVGPGRLETWEDARKAFDKLRAATEAAGLPTPYIVAQGWSPERLKEQAQTLGLDAIGAYASSSGAKQAAYAELAEHTERWWDSFKATGMPVVPLATAGWDMRPRVETPVPWIDGGHIDQYYDQPTPKELAAHVQAALDWCKSHPETAKAQAVLIYAWNEFDEGGWLCPTLEEGTARLDALREVLQPAVHERDLDQEKAQRPSLGAIRWDAWTEWEKYKQFLYPEEWHYRLPFFAEIRDDGTVEIRGDRMDVVNQEIEYAHEAGIDYWAWCWYDPWREDAPHMNDVLELYRQSPKRHLVNYCLIGPGYFATQNWHETVAMFVDMFQEPNYQKLQGNRPLFYYFEAEAAVPHFRSEEAAREAIQYLRDETIGAGLGNPYIVALTFWPDKAAEAVETVGFDAFGSYCNPPGAENRELEYSELAALNRWFWNASAEKGIPFVPPINAGWDPRPRKTLESVDDDGNWSKGPEPEELRDHVLDALQWLAGHPEINEPNTILIYAWNEFDEGGWIAPTLKEGTARLDAIAEAIQLFGADESSTNP